MFSSTQFTALSILKVVAYLFEIRFLSQTLATAVHKNWTEIHPLSTTLFQEPLTEKNIASLSDRFFLLRSSPLQ